MVIHCIAGYDDNDDEAKLEIQFKTLITLYNSLQNGIFWTMNIQLPKYCNLSLIFSILISEMYLDRFCVFVKTEEDKKKKRNMKFIYMHHISQFNPIESRAPLVYHDVANN